MDDDCVESVDFWVFSCNPQSGGAMVVVDSGNCCCMHIKTCAIIVGVLGTLGALGIFVPSFIALISLPFAIFMLLTYIFILIGAAKESDCCLLTAEIFLGIKLVCSALIILIILTIGVGLSEALGRAYKEYDPENNEDIATVMKTVTLYLTLFVLFLSSWNIYSCIIVHKTRTWICEKNSMAQAPIIQSTYHYGAPAPMQVQVINNVGGAPATPTPTLSPVPSAPAIDNNFKN